MDNRRGPPGAQDNMFLPEAAFGHPGYGGSIGFADPEARVSFGYNMNRNGPGRATQSARPELDRCGVSIFGLSIARIRQLAQVGEVTVNPVPDHARGPRFGNTLGTGWKDPRLKSVSRLSSGAE